MSLPRISLDHAANARAALAQAKASLDTASTDRERRMIRTNIAQIEAWLKAQGVDVAS